LKILKGVPHTGLREQLTLFSWENRWCGLAASRTRSRNMGSNWVISFFAPAVGEYGNQLHAYANKGLDRIKKLLQLKK
jgi:hypothetical protein